MKIIHMRLTFKWYDLIDCGYKTHEYRLVDKWKARLNGVKRGDFYRFPSWLYGQANPVRNYGHSHNARMALAKRGT